MQTSCLTKARECAPNADNPRASRIESTGDVPPACLSSCPDARSARVEEGVGLRRGRKSSTGNLDFESLLALVTHRHAGRAGHLPHADGRTQAVAIAARTQVAGHVSCVIRTVGSGLNGRHVSPTDRVPLVYQVAANEMPGGDLLQTAFLQRCCMRKADGRRGYRRTPKALNTHSSASTRRTRVCTSGNRLYDTAP
jgi:hypothetical protein